MQDLGIGQLLTAAAERDAIHIAIAPVEAAESLLPGQPIGFVGSDNELVGATAKTIGIVDPYLNAPIRMGQKFWMFLYPNTVTSLRHEWEHPAFNNYKEIAKEWLTDFASGVGYTLTELMSVLGEARSSGSACVGNDSTQEHFDANRDKLWRNYALLTGKPIPEEHSGYFRCAC